MVNKLNSGDYVAVGSSIARAQGQEAAFCNALFRLQCRRGSFPFLPDLGSRLWMLGRERPADRAVLARQYCAEALSGSGVRAENVCVREQGGALLVETELRQGEDTVSVEVSV